MDMTQKLREQRAIQAHCAPNPQRKDKEPPQWSRQFCYRDKLPMDWGIPQQTE